MMNGLGTISGGFESYGVRAFGTPPVASPLGLDSTPLPRLGGVLSTFKKEGSGNLISESPVQQWRRKFLEEHAEIEELIRETECKFTAASVSSEDLMRHTPDIQAKTAISPMKGSPKWTPAGASHRTGRAPSTPPLTPTLGPALCKYISNHDTLEKMQKWVVLGLGGVQNASSLDKTLKRARTTLDCLRVNTTSANVELQLLADNVEACIMRTKSRLSSLALWEPGGMKLEEAVVMDLPVPRTVATPVNRNIYESIYTSMFASPIPFSPMPDLARPALTGASSTRLNSAARGVLPSIQDTSTPSLCSSRSKSSFLEQGSTITLPSSKGLHASTHKGLLPPKASPTGTGMERFITAANVRKRHTVLKESHIAHQERGGTSALPIRRQMSPRRTVHLREGAEANGFTFVSRDWLASSWARAAKLASARLTARAGDALLEKSALPYGHVLTRQDRMDRDILVQPSDGDMSRSNWLSREVDMRKAVLEKTLGVNDALGSISPVSYTQRLMAHARSLKFKTFTLDILNVLELPLSARSKEALIAEYNRRVLTEGALTIIPANTKDILTEMKLNEFLAHHKTDSRDPIGSWADFPPAKGTSLRYDLRAAQRATEIMAENLRKLRQTEMQLQSMHDLRYSKDSNLSELLKRVASQSVS